MREFAEKYDQLAECAAAKTPNGSIAYFRAKRLRTYQRRA